MTGDGTFADVLAANEEHVRGYDLAGLAPRATRGLAVLACIDSRIDPLALLGLAPGEASVLRTAGARVTDEVLRTLVIAVHLLRVDRIMVVAHTKCRMAVVSEDALHRAVREAGGPDTRSLSFATIDDPTETVLADVQRVRSWPYLQGVSVGGFVYDLDDGRLTQLC